MEKFLIWFKWLEERRIRVSATVIAVLGFLVSLGIDLGEFSPRKGEEIWRYTYGGFKNVQSEDLRDGDIVVRLEWTGEGKDFRKDTVYKYPNSTDSYSFIDLVNLNKKPEESDGQLDGGGSIEESPSSFPPPRRRGEDYFKIPPSQANPFE